MIMRHDRSLTVFLPVALALQLLAGASAALAADPAAHAQRHRYLLSTSHTPEQCADSLRRVAAKDKRLFESMDWGCKAGEHVGYALVWAKSPDEAVMKLPDTERSGAKAVLMTRFTVEEARRMHGGR